METIGGRLRHARERRAWSQRDLAERAGLPQQTVLRVEHDRYENRPRPSTIRKLAEALGVDPGWLLFGDEGQGKVAA